MIEDKEMLDVLTGKKVIIFDMDGTLIDSVGIWNQVDEALIGRIRSETAPRPENVQAQRDEALRRFSKAEEPYMEYCALLKEKYGATQSLEEIHALRYQIAQDFLQNVIDYKPGADALIRWLKERGYTLVIATTTKRSNMDVYRTRNPGIMGKANIDDYFDRVYTREDAREIKPNPEIYLRVIKELGVSAEECLIFEDSLIGIEAAKNAGIQSVAVYDSYSDGERDQINALSDYQVEHYPELLMHLSNP